MTAYDRMSACGLNCKTCPILMFPDNSKIQEGIIAWFRREKWLGESEGVKEAVAKKMYCKGCLDKDVFWGGDCAVGKCCKNTRRLSNCSECNDFPCDKSGRWLETHQGDKYQEAYRYLEQLKTGK
jgi:hypothetical protein